MLLSYVEFEAASNKFALLVPTENKRKVFLRLFKWVISFATWKYSSDNKPKEINTEVDEMIHQQRKKFQLSVKTPMKVIKR